jgi:hypothetical protein
LKTPESSNRKKKSWSCSAPIKISLLFPSLLSPPPLLSLACSSAALLL